MAWPLLAQPPQARSALPGIGSRAEPMLLKAENDRERAEAALVAPVRDGACVDTEDAAGPHSSVSPSKLSDQTHLRGSFETANCNCAPVRRRRQLRPISVRMKCPAGRDSSTAESRRLETIFIEESSTTKQATDGSGDGWSRSRLMGRCASGAVRDEGTLVHAVQGIGRCARATRGRRSRIRSRPRR